MKIRKFNRVLRSLPAVFLVGMSLWCIQVMGSAWIRARGDQLMTQQRFGAAERWFEAAARLDPQNWQAHYGIGQILFEARYHELDPELKRAAAMRERAAYERAYRINPLKEEVVYGLARTELFLGNRERGLELLRQVAVYKRFNDFYSRKLGIELRKAGLYDEALAAFEHAQKLDRSNKTVRRNIEWLKKRM